MLDTEDKKQLDRIEWMLLELWAREICTDQGYDWRSCTPQDRREYRMLAYESVERAMGENVVPFQPPQP